MALNEADTCRKLVTPKLLSSSWDTEPHRLNEQVTFTDGRIVVYGQRARRKEGKRADYLLRFRPNLPIAVVEAKAEDRSAGAGLQQAKEYAEMLGLQFAYSTNGHSIVEFDYTTGLEREIDRFPRPDELWSRLATHDDLREEASELILSPFYHMAGRTPRYYQEIAVNRAVQAIASRQSRSLLTMATGTGKTFVAFQICWKLWSSRWNLEGTHRRPRILYLADRNILIDDPIAKDFAPFGDARFKIENGEISKAREMYFAIYQAIAQDERRPGLYKEYASDFFDLVIVDECHRGSARDESEWREILDHFSPAAKLGMTATPLRGDNANTYRYFGPPLYTYSLRQGIEDGFLAPYRVHRVVTTWDAAGWRPSRGDLDRYAREIPDEPYGTGDFETRISLRKRTEAIAAHLSGFLKKTGRFGKTIVFCVDQEHADEMRRALNNANSDLTRDYSDYVCRVTSDEGGIGRGHLSKFQDVESTTPVILTTSQLLTTGVDAPTVSNIVIFRVINSMTEFKQVIGRGTRVRDDYGKLFFSILDYTGSATRLFADPEFDGEPVIETETEIDEWGKETTETVIDPGDSEHPDASEELGSGIRIDDEPLDRRKFYFDGGQVEIATHLVYELDSEGRQLRVVRLTDYTGSQVRTMYRNAASFRRAWAKPEDRVRVIEALRDRGIDFDDLARSMGQPDADPFDLLCHMAFSSPIRTRRERAQRLRKERGEFFSQYAPEAREILDELLEKYCEHGTAQFVIPDVLELPPISRHGNVLAIAKLFSGEENLRTAVENLQTLLYEAA